MLFLERSKILGKGTTPSPAKPTQGWVLLLLDPFHVLPFPNSPFQPWFGLCALPFAPLLLPSEDGCAPGVPGYSPAGYSPPFSGCSSSRESPEAGTAGRAAHTTLQFQKLLKLSSWNGQECPCGSSTSHTRRNVRKRNESTVENPSGSTAGIPAHLGTAPAVPGWDHREGEGTMPGSALGRGGPGDARVHFCQNLLCSRISSWGWLLLGQLPQLSLLASHRESLQSPGPGGAAGQSPRGLSHPCGSARAEMTSARIFWEMGFPKNSCSCSAPSQLLGGRHSITSSSTFFFHSNINPKSPHGAEVTQEAVTSLTSQKAV